MENFVIIDGHSLLFQMFYGMPNKISNSHGQNIEAIIGFLGALKKITTALMPQKLFIIFDGENELIRKQDNADYKSNRIDYTCVAPEETPFPQLEILKTILTHLNIAWFEAVGEEADDLIAKYANSFSLNHKVYIVSSDKDFFQLINNNINVYTYRGKLSKLWTPEECLKQYGFPCCYFGTFKALSGDTADNIKGLYGVGAVTAKKLINEYGNVESIIKNIPFIKNCTLKALLQNNIDLLKCNFKIIDLQNKFLDSVIEINLNFKKIVESTNDILKELNLN